MLKIVMKCFCVGLLLSFNIATVQLHDSSDRTQRIQSESNLVVTPVDDVVNFGGSGVSLDVTSQRKLHEPLASEEIFVYHSQPFPGEVDDLRGDYVLTAKIQPEGEWDVSTFEIAIGRLGRTDNVGQFTAKVSAANDGSQVVGQISLVHQKSASDVAIAPFDAFEFEVLWLRIERRGEMLTVASCASEVPVNFKTLLTLEVLGQDALPIVSSDGSDGLRFISQESKLEAK